MTYEIKIVVDTNDADYNTSVNTISDNDLLQIKPLINAIRNFKPYSHGMHTHRHNYPYGEYGPREDLGELFPNQIYKGLSKEAFEIFEEYCPFGEHGFHTIESVEIWPVVKKTRLL